MGAGGGGEQGRKRRKNWPFTRKLTPLLHGKLTSLDVTMRRNLVALLSGRRRAGVIPAPLSRVSKAAWSSCQQPGPEEKLWEGADSVLLDSQTRWGDQCYLTIGEWARLSMAYKVQNEKSRCGHAEGGMSLHLLST